MDASGVASRYAGAGRSCLVHDVISGMHSVGCAVDAPGLDQKFKVCSKVGSGGYGACMVVKNEVTAETMVAKIAMGKSLSCRVCVKTALRKEFAALCKLNHPNFVRAYAIVNVVPGPGIAMLLPHLACDLWHGEPGDCRRCSRSGGHNRLDHPRR